MLRFFYRNSPHQYRLTGFVAFFDVISNSYELGFFGFINKVRIVNSNQRSVGGDRNNFQPISVSEFARFGRSRTCHPRDLLVHTEIILESYRGQRLVLFLNPYPFFSFNRLM